MDVPRSKFSFSACLFFGQYQKVNTNSLSVLVRTFGIKDELSDLSEIPKSVCCYLPFEQVWSNGLVIAVYPLMPRFLHVRFFIYSTAFVGILSETYFISMHKRFSCLCCFSVFSAYVDCMLSRVCLHVELASVR